MRRLSHDELRRRTLRRQFPAIPRPWSRGGLELFRRLGPIQSQVPRAPFLTISSRLPGVSYDTVCELFEPHQLLKTSNIRGTVHTSVPEQFAWLDAVARRSRATQLRNVLKLRQVTPGAAGRRDRSVRLTWTGGRAPRSWRTPGPGWPNARDSWRRQRCRTCSPTACSGVTADCSGAPATRAGRSAPTSSISGPGACCPICPSGTSTEALTELVRVHLGSYGPALREDLAFFFGAGLGAVDDALRRLGDEVVHLRGPDDEDYLDLADPPSGGTSDPGLRLLPEFDGLLVGYHGRNRTRFLTEQQLPKVWAKVNGLFSPVVLYGGRLVASWKTITKGRRTDIEVTMLDPHPVLADDLFDDAIAATEQVLDLKITDLRVRSDTLR